MTHEPFFGLFWPRFGSILNPFLMLDPKMDKKWSKYDITWTKIGPKMDQILGQKLPKVDQKLAKVDQKLTKNGSKVDQNVSVLFFWSLYKRFL